MKAQILGASLIGMMAFSSTAYATEPTPQPGTTGVSISRYLTAEQKHHSMGYLPDQSPALASQAASTQLQMKHCYLRPVTNGTEARKVMFESQPYAHTCR